MRKFLAAAASAALCVMSAASAATFHSGSFHLWSGGSGGYVGNVTNNLGDVIDLYVYASTERYGAFTPISSGLVRWSSGLGIDRGENSPQHAVDGRGRNEALIFQARDRATGDIKAVRWDSVLFGWEGDRRTDFDVWTSQAGYVDLSRVADEVPVRVNQTQLLGYVASTIAIHADGRHDYFKLKKIAASALDEVVVPVPGALSLMLAGLGGIAAMRRRKA
ncbi:PEP-CTERM sorting domain-containing protein [Parvularcula sp. ZS-1/3]|uniref:PEP-CTERM sorting domain-containing protein n=1 Tax=Parvularcula mediterranea TaxID=2732508 RepID=A0A7Y3RKU1_9PROT|nr:VPLPA-CTERM sorting domain-containing protein [Parvularcula mediterranea]NNU15917.1 PEP-CTERM sorting domain-containing protein [Parvularcula mediterranea]